MIAQTASGWTLQSTEQIRLLVFRKQHFLIFFGHSSTFRYRVTARMERPRPWHPFRVPGMCGLYKTTCIMTVLSVTICLIILHFTTGLKVLPIIVIVVLILLCIPCIIQCVSSLVQRLVKVGMSVQLVKMTVYPDDDGDVDNQQDDDASSGSYSERSN